MAEPSEKAGARKRTSNVTRVLLVLTALGALVFLGSIGLTVYLFSLGGKATVTEGTWLHAELKGILSDAPSQGGLFLDPSQSPPIVTEISRAVRRAATDDRIEGVLVVLDAPQMGWASAKEIRDSLVDLRAAGKPCVVYSELYTSGTYYLASACDRVVLAPSGISLVSGLSISVTYYAETLAKLGIEPEFEHVGDFKSAVEPYERTEPSPAAEQAYNDLVDGLYEEMVAAIATGRGLDPEAVRAHIDGMRLTPEAALERGFVDAVAFPDAVAKTLDTLDSEEWAEGLAMIQEDWEDKEWEEHFTALPEYVKEVRAEDAAWGDKIAVVHAEGPIQSGDGDQDLFGGALLTDGEFRKWMREVRKDESIAAVVLRVNSPGGSGLASDMMWHEVERTRAAGKPVVVSMGDYAASGGYYIAANADWIVAHPTTLTGSIGVLGGKFNLSGTFEKVGLHQTSFKRGELADMLSATRGFSEEGRAAFRDYLESFYESFVTKVAEGREMEYAEVHAVAQGRVWTGKQALERGLVDELGGLDVALAKAAELAQVEDYSIRRLPEEKTFFDLLLEDLASARSPTVEVELLDELPGAEAAIREIVLLNGMMKDGGALLYLPGNLTIE